MSTDYRIECIPNVSTADPNVLKYIEDAIKAVPNVILHFTDPGLSANRTVFTYTGPVTAVFEATEQMIRTALDHIDMREHYGVHPRMGAVDVCPFVLLDDSRFESDLLERTKAFASNMASQYGLAIYGYEHLASSPSRRNLALVRKGEYEGLEARFVAGDLPDFGPKSFTTEVAKFGATAMGVRPLMVAFNVNLAGDTKENLLVKAKKIAGLIRERDGGLPGVKSIGWYIPDLDVVQVSCNLTKPFEAGVCEVFARVQELAATLGCQAPDSELIGCIPASQFSQCSAQNLGLGRFKPFTKERILAI